jgi:prepilin-type N-terminal cleavage/methylation domain-containing protein
VCAVDRRSGTFRQRKAFRRVPGLRARAFTIIELMIVVAIIAVIAAITIPSLISSRIASYETAVVGTLRSLMNAQSTFVTRCVVDQDGDGQGEYGFFTELSGTSIPRTKFVKLAIGDVFSGAFGAIDANGVVGKAGYCFVLYLPTAMGPAITEVGGLPAANATDANAQETRWACYAWPVDYGSTGYRCFVVTQQGEICHASNQLSATVGFYDGRLGIPAPGAALVPNGQESNLEGRFPLPSETGSDGQSWAQVSGG